MAKYVAVGVLAVILLATVTYENPEPAKPEGQGVEAREVSGTFATTPEEEATTSPIETTADVATPVPSVVETPAEETQPAVAESGSVTTLPASSPKQASYVIKSGQTLSDIALEVLGSRKRWRELYEANKDKLPDPDHIRVGLELILPEISRTPTATTVTSAPSPTSGERSYTVAKGDTLYSIARAQLGSGNRWREIAQLNGIDGAGLRAGTTIRLPK